MKNSVPPNSVKWMYWILGMKTIESSNNGTVISRGPSKIYIIILNILQTILSIYNITRDSKVNSYASFVGLGIQVVTVLSVSVCLTRGSNPKIKIYKALGKVDHLTNLSSEELKKINRWANIMLIFMSVCCLVNDVYDLRSFGVSDNLILDLFKEKILDSYQWQILVDMYSIFRRIKRLNDKFEASDRDLYCFELMAESTRTLMGVFTWPYLIEVFKTLLVIVNIILNMREQLLENSFNIPMILALTVWAIHKIVYNITTIIAGELLEREFNQMSISLSKKIVSVREEDISTKNRLRDFVDYHLKKKAHILTLERLMNINFTLLLFMFSITVSYAVLSLQNV